MNTKHIHYSEWIAVFVIGLLAAYLRLGWSGINAFAQDEAMISNAALAMARDGNLVEFGTFSSVSVPFFPAGTWVFVIPFAITNDPLFATQFVGFINIISVFGLWGLARRNWTALPALVAMLIFAVSPYNIIFSRNIWQPNFLAPTAIVWGWAAYLAITHSYRPKLMIGCTVFLAGLIFQIHFAGAAIIAATGYLFIRYRWWKHIISVIIGGLLTALGTIPYFYEVMCCAPTVVDLFEDTMAQPSTVDFDSIKNIMHIASGSQWRESILGTLAIGDNNLMVSSMGLLVIIGLLALIRELRHVEQRPFNELILVWLIASPLLFLRHSSPVNTYYQLVSLPAIALIAGNALNLINHKYWRFALSGIALVITISYSIIIGQTFDQAHKTLTPVGLGTPLKYTREAAYGFPDDTPIIFFTHGGDPEFDGLAASFKTLWWHRPENRIIDGTTLLVLPPQPAYLLAELEPFQAWEEITAAGLANGEIGTFPRREGAPDYMWAKYDGQQPPADFIMLDAPIALANGVQLEGWKARWVGPRLRISTLWRVIDRVPTTGTYQQFHHLRDINTLEGSPIVGSDVKLSLQTWKIGDHVIVMGDFWPENDGEFWVDIGHYTLPDVIRVARMDENSDFIRIGPFHTLELVQQLEGWDR